MVSNNTIGGGVGQQSNLLSAFHTLLKNYFMDYVDTVQPVEVVGVNENGSVNVKPLLQNTTTSGQVLDITDEDIIYNIPVMMLTGNNCSILFDVAIGNKGLLLACQFDISNFKETGQASTKKTNRTYSFSDGFYLPLTLLNSVPEALTLTYGNNYISIKNDKISIKGDIEVDGKITATGDIKAGDISLQNHTHDFNYTGAGQGSSLQSGTTEKP